MGERRTHVFKSGSHAIWDVEIQEPSSLGGFGAILATSCPQRHHCKAVLKSTVLPVSYLERRPDKTAEEQAAPPLGVILIVPPLQNLVPRCLWCIITTVSVHTVTIVLGESVLHE